jgi:hypothetical protein
VLKQYLKTLILSDDSCVKNQKKVAHPQEINKRSWRYLSDLASVNLDGGGDLSDVLCHAIWEHELCSLLVNFTTQR